MEVWTIAQMRAAVTEGVHTQNEMLREKMRNGKTFEEIEAVQFELQKVNVWEDAGGGGEDYVGYLLLGDKKISVRCKRQYGYDMGMGSRWTFEQVRDKVVRKALEGN